MLTKMEKCSVENEVGMQSMKRFIIIFRVGNSYKCMLYINYQKKKKKSACYILIPRVVAVHT